MRLLIGIGLFVAATVLIADFKSTGSAEAALPRLWLTPRSLRTTTPTPVPTSRTPLATATPRATATPTATSKPSTTYSNPTDACLVIDGESNVVIDNVRVGPCGREGIIIKNSRNVTLKNVRVSDSSTNIFVINSSDVTIQDSTLSNPQGPKPRGQQILLELSDSINIQRNTLSTTGGFQEDAINNYRSSNVLIEGNSITGGTSPTGCAILIDLDSDYATIRSNIIRHVPNCGIGISTGIGHLVENNDISDYGFAGSGNVGMYVWNQYPSPCRDIIIRNNKISKPNPFWNGNNCTNVVVTGTTS